MSETVFTEVEDAVGIITLNRRERHNAFDETLIAELTDALHAMAQDDAARVVVLSSAGASFSAGADLAFAALKKKGTVVEYMVKDDEGHGCSNQKNQFDFYEAMEKFLDKYVKNKK